MAYTRKGADLRTPEQHKADFLTQFARVGNVTAACKLARQGRTAVYEWLKDDPEFVTAFERAAGEATEVLESEAWRRAVKGVKQHKSFYYLGERVGEDVVTEYSDTLLIFLLKGRAPEKYRDVRDVRHSGGVVVGLDSLTTEAERADFRRFVLDGNRA